MRWRGRRESSNIEDNRSAGGGGGFRLPGGFGRSGGGGMGGPGGGFRIPVGGRSGGGLTTIIILVVLFFVLRACGIDVFNMGDQASQPPAGGSGQVVEGGGSSDEMKQFVGVVLAETEKTWEGIFQAELGRSYEQPKLVLFTGQVQSTCGFASSASGPFYCPGDRKVYLDTAFFDQLAQQFDAAGDFAQAYVIAHEVGHHVQNLTGILPRFNEERQGMSQEEANAMSVRIELQADCFAGVWGHFTRQEGLLEQGDLEEALNAAQQIGDDTLQKKMQGYVVPESFNHGTSAQRQRWFKRGFESGNLRDCDTLTPDNL